MVESLARYARLGAIAAASAAWTLAGVEANAAELGWRTVFEDTFDYVGSPRRPWQVRNEGAVADGNRLRLQSTTQPRNAFVTAFAGSPQLRNYQLSATIDPVENLNWTSADLVIRADADAYLASDGGARGSFYQFDFFNNLGDATDTIRGDGPINYVRIGKLRDGVQYPYLLQTFFPELTSPYDVTVSAIGNRIGLDINDGEVSFRVTDRKDPLRYGGIGLHTLWESATDFDNVVLSAARPAEIAPIPLPGGLPVLAGALGLIAAAGTRRVSRQ